MEYGDNLQEMLKLVLQIVSNGDNFWENKKKYFKMSSAEILIQSAKC